MAEQLLERIQNEIRVRLQASAAAVREYEVLEATLAALGEASPSTPSAVAAGEPAKARPRARRRRSAARSGDGRAPRGANRAAVLRVLGERPGVSVTELSTAAGVAKPVLYGLLKTLEERGEVVKEQLPSGTAGYRLAPADSGAEPQATSVAS